MSKLLNYWDKYYFKADTIVFDESKYDQGQKEHYIKGSVGNAFHAACVNLRFKGGHSGSFSSTITEGSHVAITGSNNPKPVKPKTFMFKYTISVYKDATNGCRCDRCQEHNEYAEPNMPDGTFRCFSCRSLRIGGAAR